MRSKWHSIPLYTKGPSESSSDLPDPSNKIAAAKQIPALITHTLARKEEGMNL